MLHGVFLQGGDIGLQGGFHPGLGGELDAPGLGKRDALGGTGQVQEGLDPTGLSHDLALQAAAVLGGRNEITLHVFLEIGKALFPFLRHRLDFERDRRVERPDKEVLGIRQIAAPIRQFRREMAVVQELDGRSQVRHLESPVAEFRKAGKQHRRNHRRGIHPFEPAETAIGIAAGKDLLQKGGRPFRKSLGGAGDDGGNQSHVVRFGKRKYVIAFRLRLGGDGGTDEVQEGRFGQCRLGSGNVDETVPKFRQERLAAHAGAEDGGMGLGEGLDRLLYRNRQEDGVGEVGGGEDRLDAQGLDGRNPDRETMAFHATGRDGDGHALDARRLDAFVFRGRIGVQVQPAFHRFVGVGRHGGGHLIRIAHIEELRFLDGHLHRDADDHLLPEIRVAHPLVMRIERHIIRGQLVGRLEGERQLAGSIGDQVRLESQGVLELGADGDIVPGSKPWLRLDQLERNGFFLRGLSGHVHRGHVDGSRTGGLHHGRRAIGDDGFLQDQVVIIRVIPLHPATHGIDIHVCYAELPQRDHRPVIPRDGVDALVVDRRQGFDVRIGLEGEGIGCPRESLVHEAVELQRQRQAGTGAGILLVEGNGFPPFEIEDLKPYGVGILGLIVQVDTREGTFPGTLALQDDLPGLQHLTALAEEGDNGIFSPVGGTHRQMDLLSHRHVGRAGQEYAADRGVQDLPVRGQFQDEAFHLILHSPFGSAPLQGIEAVGKSAKIQGDHFSGSRLPFPDDGIVFREQFIRHRNVDPVPVAVVHLHPDAGDFFSRDVFRRGRTPAAADIPDRTVQVFLLQGHEFPFGGIFHRQGHGNVFAHIHAGAKLLHLAGRVGRGYPDAVPAGFLRLESEGEGAVRRGRNMLFQDHIPPMVHLHGKVGAGKGMAGIAFHLPAHDHLVPAQVKPVVGIEGEGKGRKDELVHAEIVGGEMLFSGSDLDVEIPVALTRRKGERTGDRAEGIGLQLQTLDGLSLGIEEGYLDLLVRNDGDLVHEVALIDNRLELEDIAGIVGAAVLVDIAVDVVRAVVGIRVIAIVADAQLPAPAQVLPGTGFRRKGVIDIPAVPDRLLELLRKLGETVQPDRFADDLGVPLPKDQFHLVKGLAGNIIGHISGVSFRLPPDRQGKRMLVVVSRTAEFAVHGFQGI